KAREPSLPWEKNKDWTVRALTYLTDNPTLRIKLFSDSTSKAKEEGRRKVSNADGRAVQFKNLAIHIFGGIDEYKVADVAFNPTRYTKSTQQHFARFKS
ncbi:hypothetical protein BDQ17DRAFT_1255848, partial [Cyathus striatus]